MDEPLIYTIRGNLPIASLKLETEWVLDNAFIKFIERYRDSEGEVVRESAHVYSFAGVTGEGQAGNF